MLELAVGAGIELVQASDQLADLRLGRLLPLALGVLGGAFSIYLLVGEIGSTTATNAPAMPRN